MTWAGWIPALGRNDEERERRPRGTLWPYLLELIRYTEIHRIGNDVGLQRAAVVNIDIDEGIGALIFHEGRPAIGDAVAEAGLRLQRCAAELVFESLARGAIHFHMRHVDADAGADVRGDRQGFQRKAVERVQRQ